MCLSVFMEMKLSWRNQSTTMLFVSEMEPGMSVPWSGLTPPANTTELAEVFVDLFALTPGVPSTC